MMDYLSFVKSYHYTHNINYLVSGNDEIVMNRCLNDIVEQAYLHQHHLIILDDMNIDYHSFSHFGYDCQSGIGKDIRIYDPFRMENLKGLSVFRELLEKMDYDEKRKNKLINYLKFIQYLENLNNQSQVIDIDLIMKYSSSLQVERKINELIQQNIIDAQEQYHLLSKYSEISEAGADFEDIFYMLYPLVHGKEPVFHAPNALIYSIERYKNDQVLKKVICYLLSLYIEEHSNVEIIIFDKGYGSREYLFDFISQLSRDIIVHMISYDVMTINDHISNIFHRFSLKIFSQHSSMSSCSAIEKMYGDVDMIKNAYTVSYDRRFSANKPWDILMGKNKQEVYTKNAPTKEARYPKEMIFSFPLGMCLVDYCHHSSIFKL